MRGLISIVLIVSSVLITLPLKARDRANQEVFKPRFWLGLDFTPEWHLSDKGCVDYDYPNKGFYPTMGLNLLTQLSKRSGAEFGVYYRSFDYQSTYGKKSIPGLPLVLHDYTSGYVSLRLLYRFYSNIVDISVGFNADIAVGDQVDLWPNPNNNSWNLYGFMFQISKDIPIYKGLIFQPEIHVNPCIGADGASNKTTYRGIFLGLGIGLKYQF